MTSTAKTITFDTYPDMFSDYIEMIENENYDHEARYFTVPIDWATEYIRKEFGMDMDTFAEEYTHDDTELIYRAAIADKVVENEHTVDLMARYKVVYDGGHFIDSFECDSLLHAQDTAIQILEDWMVAERESRKDPENPTEYELETWDFMIAENGVWVEELDLSTGEYEKCWEPEDSTLEKIGWTLNEKQ